MSRAPGRYHLGVQPWVRYVLVFALLLAAYYTFIFWYAGSYRRDVSAHLKWKYELGNGQDLCADPLSDGSVVASSEGTIHWVNPDGTQRATYRVLTQPGYAFSGFAWAAGAGDLCFLSRPQHDRANPTIIEIEAVDEQGQRHWHQMLPANPLKGETLLGLGYSDDAAYVLLTTGLLSRFSLEGELEWQQELGTPGQLLDGQMVVARDGWVYIVNHLLPRGGEVAAYDELGAERWRAQVSPDFGRPSVGPDGTLYLTEYGGGLTALDRSGARRWQYNAPAGPSGFSLRELLLPGWGGYGSYAYSGYASPQLSGSNVCYLHAGKLICVGPDGKLRWSVRVPGEPLAAAGGPDGSIYVSAQGYGVVAYGPDGRLRWRNRAIRNVTSAPSVGPDGTVFVEGDATLFAFEP